MLLKRGFEYALSGQKRALDLALVSLVTPGFIVAERAVTKNIRLHGGASEAVFAQQRIGFGHLPFDIQKLCTINPTTEQPWNNLAADLRRLGLDEIAQIRNIRNRQMSVAGYRPLIPEEFEEVRDNLPTRLGDEWAKVTKYTMPGIVSSHGIDQHVNPAISEDHERRAENDVRDAYEASLTNDLMLIGKLCLVAVARRL